jgi:hypothetical protein
MQAADGLHAQARRGCGADYSLQFGQRTWPRARQRLENIVAVVARPGRAPRGQAAAAQRQLGGEQARH